MLIGKSRRHHTAERIIRQKASYGRRHHMAEGLNLQQRFSLLSAEGSFIILFMKSGLNKLINSTHF